jgi:hypothetical protein
MCVIAFLVTKTYEHINKNKTREKDDMHVVVFLTVKTYEFNNKKKTREIMMHVCCCLLGYGYEDI